MLKRTGILGFAFIIFLIIGEVKCIVKFVKCDFEPDYKAEIIYPAAFLTGLGGVIGWFDIGEHKE